MSRLTLKLPDDQLNAIRQYAARRRTPLSLLIRDYVPYLLQGGEPIAPPCQDDLPAGAIVALAQVSGVLDWLDDEPDLYSADDGEPVPGAIVIISRSRTLSNAPPASMIDG